MPNPSPLRHPLAFIPEGRRSAVLLALVGATVLVTLLMGPSGAGLLTPAAPWAIVSLELARTPAEASRVMTSWVQQSVLADAITNVRLDYLFLLAYAPTIALAGLLSMRALERRPRLASLGPLLGWGALLAGLLDAVENIALLRLLERPGDADASLSFLAFACAALKFLLVALGLLYSAAGVFSRFAPSPGRAA